MNKSHVQGTTAQGWGHAWNKGLDVNSKRAQPHILRCPHPLLDVDYKMRVINIPLGYVKKSMRSAVTNKTCMLFMGKPLLSGHYAMGIKGWTGNQGSNLGSQGIVCKALILV